MSIFENSLEKLKKRIAEIEITPQTLISIMKFAMEIIELSSLKGDEQKEMVLRLLKAVVTNSDLNENRKKTCVEMIDGGALAQTIDLIIDATKGRININQEVIVNAAKKYVPLLCGCCQG